MLIDRGLMTDSGYKSIKITKQNSTWFILDSPGSLIIPIDSDLTDG